MRHLPELGSVLKASDIVFGPWQKMSESALYTGTETDASKT
jgi:hypothetical protein